MENTAQVKPGGENDPLTERLFIYFLKPVKCRSSNSHFSVLWAAMGPKCRGQP